MRDELMVGWPCRGAGGQPKVREAWQEDLASQGSVHSLHSHHCKVSVTLTFDILALKSTVRFFDWYLIGVHSAYNVFVNLCCPNIASNATQETASDADTLVNGADEDDEIDEGRLSTPQIRTSGSPYVRHHLDRTTPVWAVPSWPPHPGSRTPSTKVRVTA